MSDHTGIHRKRIFIGSSSETKQLAEKIKKMIGEKLECALWYEDFFSLGNYVFRDLIQKIITFDYAILIGGDDDDVTRRSTNTQKTSPRDNVYIEYGLFTGALSSRKVLLLLDRKCQVATDLAGMTINEYEDEEDALRKCENWINMNLQYQNNPELLTSTFDARDIELLPTVGIAIGYYHNFLEPFVNMLQNMLDENDETPFIFKGREINDFRVTVIIPEYQSDDNINNYVDQVKRIYGLKKGTVGYRYFWYDPKELDRNVLSVYDLPTTILAVFQTVNSILDASMSNDDRDCAKQRALDNFWECLIRKSAGNNNLKLHVSIICSRLWP